RPVNFQSEAEIYIPYVLDNKSLTPGASDSSVQTIDQSGQGVINSEVEFLSSFDLSLQVADLIGPEKILAKAGGGNDRGKAAGILRKGLLAEALPRTAVIRLVLQHPDPEVVQP